MPAVPRGFQALEKSRLFFQTLEKTASGRFELRGAVLKNMVSFSCFRKESANAKRENHRHG